MSWSEGQIVGLGSCKPFRQTSKVFEQKVSNLTALMKLSVTFCFGLYALTVFSSTSESSTSTFVLL